VTYTPNALGQPTGAGSYATGVSYYPNGAIKQFTYGNGIVHTLSQNTRQLPDTSRDAYGTIEFIDDGYDYDTNGNVAAISDGLMGARGNRTMIYDGLDRLTDTTAPMYGAGGAHYTYDALDNLKTMIAPGRNHTYVYDPSTNRLTNVSNIVGGASVIGLGYDAQGNLANKNGVLYSFDQGNRLRGVTGSPASAYVYDGLGRRVRDSTSASKHSLYSQAGQLMYATDLRAAQNSDYIYLGGSLVAIRSKATATGVLTTKYQHTDALGSPIAVSSSTRTLLERSEYEPYGKLLNRPLADGSGYAGHVSDATTGLSYMQQRYYDTGIGRFLSVDPVTANASTGANFNRYWYANNNPYKFSDPDGREVVVNIDRDTYTDNSVTSRLSVTSDKTNLSFSGYTLEDARGGRNRDKDPLEAGVYAATVRTDGKKGWRLELEPKNNYKNVQVHVGNTATDVEGCFAAGTARSIDFVSGSKDAMKSIQSVVEGDGTGQIKVNVQGAGSDGFKGVFRVEGRIDSARLDKDLHSK
jgi:RHS repeat-associated protein